MPSLTSREQLLVVAVLAAMLVGAVVKHWRDARREAHALAVGPPTAAAR